MPFWKRSSALTTTRTADTVAVSKDKVSFWILWVLSIMPKIPEISVGIQMEKSFSVYSDRNIRDHLWRWSTYFGWNISTEISRSIFDKPVHYPD